MQRFLFLVLLTIFFYHPGFAALDTIPVYAGYKLVWQDEFDKNGTPDPANWNFEKGFARNNELQWYQTENARCENGFLVIEGRKESKPNPLYKADGDWRQKRQHIEYTSSSIKTQGLKSWTYGRFEMRGKIDISSGIWPAWWTLGVKGRWPHNGEIDIMEFYRGMLLANVATGDSAPYKAKWFSTRKQVTTFNDPQWSSKFHTWRMDWSEEEIALYVDDQLLNKVAISELVNRDGSGINPFKQDHYMLLNLAIGGDNGGDVTNTSFPRQFEVDYVRVWQKTK